MIRTLLITEGFGFCVSLSCVLGYRLDHIGTVCGSAWYVISGLLISLLIDQAVTAAALFIWYLTKKIKTSHTSTQPVISRSTSERLREWGIVSLVLLLLWLPVFLAYYPAVFSYDAEGQLYQVISGDYSTHHPLFHTLILGAFMKLGFTDSGINNGMAMYAVFQACVMALMISAAITVPWRPVRMMKRAAVVILTVFFGVFPAFGILMISTTKDIIFSGFVLLMSVLLADLSEHYADKGRFAAIGAVTVGAMLFRNNAVYACAAMIVVLLIWGYYRDEKGVKHREWKLIFTLGISLVLSLMLLAGIKGVLGAKSGSPREALSIPIQQMARVKVLHGEELDPALADDLSVLIDDEWADKYNSHLADPIKERINMKQPKVFISTWIRLGLKYPSDYIDAWLFTTEGAWYLRDTSCDRIYGEGRESGFGYLNTDIRTMPDGFTVTRRSLMPGLFDSLENIVSDNSFERIPVLRILFAPALYFWLLILYVYICVIKRDRKHILPAVYLLIYFLTLMLSPAILVRYMLPYMLTAPILLGYRYDHN